MGLRKPICNANLHPKTVKNLLQLIIFLVRLPICVIENSDRVFVERRIAQISSFTLAYFTGISFLDSFFLLNSDFCFVLSTFVISFRFVRRSTFMGFLFMFIFYFFSRVFLCFPVCCFFLQRERWKKKLD